MLYQLSYARDLSKCIQGRAALQGYPALMCLQTLFLNEGALSPFHPVLESYPTTSYL